LNRSGKKENTTQNKALPVKVRFYTGKKILKIKFLVANVSEIKAKVLALNRGDDSLMSKKPC